MDLISSRCLAVFVQLTIAAENDVLATGSLFSWLRKSPLEDDGSTLELRVGGDGSAMGTLDTINILVSNSVSLASLLLAYTAWRQSRRAAPTITFTVDSITVTAEDATPATVERITRVLEAALTPDDDAA
jgi:hypothetical protein